MKLLLDTHIWIWSRSQPERLAAPVAAEIENPENELWLSPLSMWEFLLLLERGRLIRESSIEAWFTMTVGGVPLREAVLTNDVALETRLFKLPHRDPIDRLLVATAKVYDLTLVTADERLMGVKGVRLLANR